MNKISATWTKTGWRSLRSKGLPKVVVRFTGGVGKLKILENEKEFQDREIAAGRQPQVTLNNLLDDATRHWAQLKGK